MLPVHHNINFFKSGIVFYNSFSTPFAFLILPKPTNLKIDQSRQFHSANF